LRKYFFCEKFDFRRENFKGGTHIHAREYLFIPNLYWEEGAMTTEGADGALKQCPYRCPSFPFLVSVIVSKSDISGCHWIAINDRKRAEIISTNENA
jgi:hypothetical protein